MTNSVYIIFAFILPFLIIGGSIPVVMWLARNKNEAFTRNHVQVCVLSDTVDKKYYQCGEPENGALTIELKKSDGSISGTKEVTGKEFLAMRSHPGHYPPRGWRQIQAPITEFYVTDSFVPFSLEKTDPLEVASALFRLEHEGVTAIVVKQAHVEADKEKKGQQVIGSKPILQLILIMGLICVVMGGVTIYLVMKSGASITDIINGLRALGVIH